jgi:hypothetical protein
MLAIDANCLDASALVIEGMSMRPEFQPWLRQCPSIGLSPERDALSRCKRVEAVEGDLDQHFAIDRMATLLTRLKYSREDERSGLGPRHSIRFRNGANVKEGTNSLANAVRLYLKFSDDFLSNPASIPSGLAACMKPMAFTHLKATREVSSWPVWELPSNEELLQLAKITVPYIRFLHPDIVRAVIDDNEDRREAWGARLAKRGIEPSAYLWERSACTFPGVRRYEGKERAGWKKYEGPETLDDNAYPKEIWSFVFRGACFAKQGPDGYSLAHLADHKPHKNRGQHEFDTIGQGLKTLPGLYTTITNTVYMPIGLIRPTDFSFSLRNLIQRKANSIYGDFCKLLPPHLSIRASESDAWSLNSFRWSDPVGTSEHVAAFLQYRNKEMERILSKPAPPLRGELRAGLTDCPYHAALNGG